jgi:hypothetical protein
LSRHIRRLLIDKLQAGFVQLGMDGRQCGEKTFPIRWVGRIAHANQIPFLGEQSPATSAGDRLIGHLKIRGT